MRPLAEKSFVEQMKDTREPIVFTYIRRPGYYAAFASAPKVISEQQRLGLTFVWTPEKGVLLQSQTNGRETAWGTSAGGALPVEATGLDADIQRTAIPWSATRSPAADKRPSPSPTIAFASPSSARARSLSASLSSIRPASSPRRKCKAGPAPAGRSGQAPAPCANPEAGCPTAEGPVPGKTLSVVELHATGKLEYEIRPA